VIPKSYNGVITDGSNYDLGSGGSGNDIITNYLKTEGVKVLYDRVFGHRLQVQPISKLVFIMFNQFSGSSKAARSSNK
jgi:hypothetical protein